MKHTKDIQTIDSGRVLAEAALRVSTWMAIDDAQLARVLEIGEADVAQMRTGDRAIAPRTPEGARAARLVLLWQAIREMTGGDDSKMLAWLGSYNLALQAVPRGLIQASEGIGKLEAYLERMRGSAGS